MVVISVLEISQPVLFGQQLMAKNMSFVKQISFHTSKFLLDRDVN